jgi:hypothetical protein
MSHYRKLFHIDANRGLSGQWQPFGVRKEIPDQMLMMSAFHHSRS